MCKRLSAGVIIGLTFALPAYANSDLSVIQGTNSFEGALTEFSTPDGITCRFKDAERQGLTVGAGISRGAALPSSSGQGVFLPARIASPEPVVALSYRIPFGAKYKGCDSLIKLQEMIIRYDKAMELFEAGVIEQEQLEVLAAKFYDSLINF